MGVIVRPVRWWDFVSPQEEEMPDFLKVIAQGWRTPKRHWEDLWRLRRGELNHVLGMRQAPKLRKRQLGIIGLGRMRALQASGDTPNLQDITNATSSVAPQSSRQQYAYDSDGSMRGDLDATSEASIAYADLTTLTDDANDHTNDWWPNQPDTNEGLNWDIRYQNEADVGPEPYTASHLLADNTGVNRTSGTWYLLDTVSNDHADATHDGGIGVNRGNGVAKTPDTGLSTMTVDVEIRATGSGSAVASHSYDLDVEGT